MGVGSFMGELSWFARLQALQLPTRSVSWVAFRSRPLLCFEQLGYPHGLRRCWWADRCWRPTGSHDWKVGPILQRPQRLLAALDASVRAQHAYLVRFYLKCFFLKERPYLTKLSKETLGCKTSLDWPEGGWQKGATTTLLMATCHQNSLACFLLEDQGEASCTGQFVQKMIQCFLFHNFSSGGMAWRVAHWWCGQCSCSTGCQDPIHRCGSAPWSHFVALSFQSLCFTLLQAHPNEAEHECCFQAAFQGRGVASSTGCGWDCPLWLAALASIQEGGRNFSCNAPATLSDPSKNAYALPHIQIPGSSVAI